MTSSLLDTALDLSVVGGYTSVGYRIRSRGWNALPRMECKVVMVTGATSGLGLAAADGLARLGATVWLAVRDRERGEQARALRHTSPSASRPTQAERLAGPGVTVHATHPGWADTPGVQSSLPSFYRATRPLLRTPVQGAETIVWRAGAGPAESSGGFWHDRRRRPTHVLPGTRESPVERRRRWAECVALSSTVST